MPPDSRFVSQNVKIFSKGPISPLFRPSAHADRPHHRRLRSFVRRRSHRRPDGLSPPTPSSAPPASPRSPCNPPSASSPPHPTPAPVLRATLDCLEADLPPAGIKIGMISTEDNTLVICDYLEKHQLQHWHQSGGWVPVVLDPVLRSNLRQGTARSGGSDATARPSASPG